MPITAPTGLGPKSRKLWRAITGDYDLRVDELRVLEDACREIDLIDRLETELRDSPLMVKGSMGQKVASPLVQELRQHRAVLARLLAQLKLPDDTSEQAGQTPESSRSTAARTAATARWSRGA
jgi:hypothetical protein